MDNEDLAIKCDILAEKIAKMERALEEIKPEVVLCYEWVPWLHKLYRWLRAVFKHCPGWTPNATGEWTDPEAGAGSNPAMQV